MANLYAYVEVVKSGHKYEGEPPEVHEGEALTGVYRVAPAFSASTATLPSVGSTASTDIWAEVLVTTHAQAPTAPSSSAGTSVIRKFPFAFDTPGLLTGHPVYTPTVGDILLDAWIEFETVWDGTTPTLDIGTFIGQNFGLFFMYLQTAIRLSQPYLCVSNTGGLLGNGVQSLAQMAAALGTRRILGVPGVPSVPQTPSNLMFLGLESASGSTYRFISTDPVKVVVSQDGSTTGADPGSTQGEAVLYLVTCTPI